MPEIDPNTPTENPAEGAPESQETPEEQEAREEEREVSNESREGREEISEEQDQTEQERVEQEIQNETNPGEAAPGPATETQKQPVLDKLMVTGAALFESANRLFAKVMGLIEGAQNWWDLKQLNMAASGAGYFASPEIKELGAIMKQNNILAIHPAVQGDTANVKDIFAKYFTLYASKGTKAEFFTKVCAEVAPKITVQNGQSGVTLQEFANAAKKVGETANQQPPAPTPTPNQPPPAPTPNQEPPAPAPAA